MARYILLAMNGPTSPGEDAAYNEWYNGTHVPDLLACEAVKSARRFKVVQQKGLNNPYVAAYDIETDDLAATLAQLPPPDVPYFDLANSAHILAIEIDPEE
ncbi:DUF4286 family protein [Sphingomonas montanisoli]|uniref:EthD family reductase n=1 Tax=Sphingomonas montanisoli TaxID=2606412 RepID=A0A5D9C8G3_9SPHN|nr:DUF4286 family protein [Sphingomonas montanisoli]TZG27380.1 hypothetical protein FYJ91_07235 [Sphingomonas montanisoli]